jgi:hypothetical protein
MEKHVTFDIEISREIPGDCDDWKSLRPLGISCAATLTDDGDLRLWHGAEMEDGRLGERMSLSECRELAKYLGNMFSAGYKIITWNGAGFDFDILAEEVCDRAIADDIRDLTWDHIDIAFQMLCENGFMCGLDAAARGMGVAGKTEGMHGDLAPAMWQRGREEQDGVLEYVAQDARATANVYCAILNEEHLRWITRAGYPARNPWRPLLISEYSGTRLMTVREASRLPLPDVGWMDNPWPRSKFIGWLGEGDQGDPTSAETVTLGQPGKLSGLDWNSPRISLLANVVRARSSKLATLASRTFSASPRSGSASDICCTYVFICR